MSPVVPTFLSVKSNSVIGLLLLSSKAKAKLMHEYNDDKAGLCTGAPKRGHVPLLSALALRPPEKKILQKPGISTLDWDAWKPKLEWKKNLGVAFDRSNKCNRKTGNEGRTSK